jgi:hypothetical protein
MKIVGLVTNKNVNCSKYDYGIVGISFKPYCYLLVKITEYETRISKNITLQ